MENTFTYEIIAQLSKPEQREVRHFLASPFFNQRQDVRALFDMLVQGGNGLDRAALWATIYPDKPFEEQTWRLLFSYLFKLLEQYLAEKERQMAPMSEPHWLLAAYRRRKLPRHFEKAQKIAAKSLDNSLLRHPGYHWERHLMEHQSYLHLLESGRTRELNLQTVETQLTTTLLAMKLRQACLLRSHQAVFSTEYRIDLLDEILALAAQAPYRDEAAVSVYRLCYLALFGEGSEERFAEFKAELFRHGSSFPKEELTSLYLLTLNFCIRKINDSQQPYLRETLDLYKQGLQSGVLLDGGQISRFTYNNVVGIALRLPEEWQWAERFVEDYRQRLEAGAQQAAYSLNSARLAFAKGRYDEALKHLQGADYKDFINGMAARILQLKVYFEKQELELLDAHLKTLRMFIRRNQRMGYHHRNWSNIVLFTQKLLELNPYDESQRAALRSAIESEEVLTEKEWLLGQL